MKKFFILLCAAAILLSGCAAPSNVYVERAPANSLRGIVADPVRVSLHFMNSLEMGAQIGIDDVRPDPMRLNYSWFYLRGQTVGQHLDAWAYRFGYRLDWQVPDGYDPYVQSDGTFVGDFYAVLEDVNFFADEGKSTFQTVSDVKRLRTKTLQVTVFEKDRFIRVQQRDRAKEHAEVVQQENDRAEALRQAQWTAFVDRFRFSK